MRKVLITLAAAGSALAFAAPAAAQYFPQPQGYGYGYGSPYGNAYGYNNNYGQIRVLQTRINRAERMIDRADQRNIIGHREARTLRREANGVLRRLRALANDGLNRYETRDMHQRVARLEQRVQIAVNQRRGWNDRRGWDDGRDNGWGRDVDNGYRHMGPDRDRDGLDDRTEDDRGTRPD